MTSPAFALCIVLFILFVATLTYASKLKIWKSLRRYLVIIACVFFLLFVISGDSKASLYFGHFGNPNIPVNFGVNGWETTWIIWSNPLIGSNITARDLIEDASEEFGGTEILVVTNLNSTTMLYNSYVVGDPESRNFKLEDGKGYWLWTYDSGWIPTTGWANNHSLKVSLKTGWNIAGINTWYDMSNWTMTIKASQILSKNSSILIVSWMYYDEGMGDHTPVWKSYVRGDPISKDFTCWIGTGVYIWANQDCIISW